MGGRDFGPGEMYRADGTGLLRSSASVVAVGGALDGVGMELSVGRIAGPLLGLGLKNC